MSLVLKRCAKSKTGCWTALGRRVALAAKKQIETNHAERWRRERDRIRDWFNAECWFGTKRAYTLRPGTERLDAAVLLASRFGFERRDQLASAREAVRRELGRGPPVYRYSGRQGGRLHRLPRPDGGGVRVARRPVLGGDEASWRAGFLTGAMGTVALVNAAMPHPEASATGVIAVISSVSGRWAWIRHDMPNLLTEALRLNPTGRVGRSEEVARAVAFLASPAAGFVTGPTWWWTAP